MQKFTLRLLSLLLVATTILTVSCKKDPTFDPTTLEFSAGTVEGSLSSTSAKITVNVASELTLYYQYHLTDAAEEGEWQEVKGSTAPQTITLENLEPESEYTVNMYTMDVAGNKSDVTTLTFTTLEYETPTVTLEPTLTAQNISIKITISGSATKLYYSIAQESEDGFPAAKQIEDYDGESEYTLTIDNSELEIGVKYELMCYAENEYKVGEMSDIEFTPSDLIVSAINPASIAVNFVVDYNTTKSWGVAYKTYNTDEYSDETFSEEIEYKSTWFTNTTGKKYNRPTMALRPNNAYTLAVVAVNYDEANNTYSMVGDIQQFDFSTTDYIIGQSDVTLPFEVTSTKDQIIEYTITNTDQKSYRYFTGAIATSEISTTLEQYLVDNNWFENKYTTQLFKYDYSLNEISSILESVNGDVYNLSPGTEYEIFTIGFDEDYKMGSIYSKTVTTTIKATDASLNITAVHSATPFSVTYEATLSDDTEKTFYKFYEDGEYSDDQVFAEIYSDMKFSWTYLEEGNTELEETHLNPNTTYNLYTLSINATEDKISELQIFSVTTLGLEATVDGSAVCDLLNTEIEPYGPGSNDRGYFAIKLDAGLTNAYVIHLSKNSLSDISNPSIDDYIALAKEGNLFSSRNYKTANSSNSILVDFREMIDLESHLLIIPMNSEGQVGTSTLYKYVRPNIN